MPGTVAELLEGMSAAARRRFGSDRRWAAACRLPPETLSRLRKRASCDFRTLEALASAAGFRLILVPAAAAASAFGRQREDELLDLAASGVPAEKVRQTIRIDDVCITALMTCAVNGNGRTVKCASTP